MKKNKFLYNQILKFILKYIMKKIIPTLLLSGSLAFWTWLKAFSWEIESQVKSSKWNVSTVLKNKSFNENEFDILFDKKILENIHLDEQQKQEIKAFMSDESFRSELFSILKKEKNWSIENIILSIILWFLYGYAYYATIVKVKAGSEISTKSFWIFSFASGWMVLLNWFIPGSLVYFESFILAFYVVYLHIQNIQRKKNTVSSRKQDDYQEDYIESKITLLKMFEDFYEPVSYYDKNERPLLWNDKMTEETGYTFDEVTVYYDEIIEKVDEKWKKYFEKRWEIISLLYKWKNFHKAMKYLNTLKVTKQWYKNITFTLTRKDGIEKSFSRSVIVDEDGGTLRFARQLSNLEEIRIKLHETEQKLLRDKLTWAHNLYALEEDFEKHINNNRRKESYIQAMFDIDNFKSINDKFWHEVGDLVLVELVKFVKKSIREIDVIYRLHGDEFIILFESNNIDEIRKKIDNIRLQFLKHTQELWIFWKWKWITTSWWLMELLPIGNSRIVFDLKHVLSMVDGYMYAIKYVKLIAPELIFRWVIQKDYKEKNGVAIPKFSQNGIFLWINVSNFDGTFFLSLADLDLIHTRKKELDDNAMRNC